MNTRIAVLLAAAALCTCTGCDEKKTPAQGVKDAASGVADAAKKGVEQTGDALQMAKDQIATSVSTQVDKINEQMTKLKAAASKVAAEQKAEFDKTIRDIETGVSSLKTKLEEMKKAGAQEWQTLQAEVTDTASQLYKDAKAAVEKWAK